METEKLTKNNNKSFQLLPVVSLRKGNEDSLLRIVTLGVGWLGWWLNVFTKK